MFLDYLAFHRFSQIEISHFICLLNQCLKKKRKSQLADKTYLPICCKTADLRGKLKIERRKLNDGLLFT